MPLLHSFIADCSYISELIVNCVDPSSTEV